MIYPGKLEASYYLLGGTKTLTFKSIYFLARLKLINILHLHLHQTLLALQWTVQNIIKQRNLCETIFFRKISRHKIKCENNGKKAAF